MQAVLLNAVYGYGCDRFRHLTALLCCQQAKLCAHMPAILQSMYVHVHGKADDTPLP